MPDSQPKSFWRDALSDRFGPSSIRLCLMGTVAISMYAVGFDVTCTHKITGYSCSVLLALIGLFSGGYFVSKKNEKDILLAQQNQKSDSSADTTGDESNDSSK